MGLHLCYRFLLPGATPIDEVRSKIAALRRFADTVGFDKVLGPVEYTADALDVVSDPPDPGQIVVSSMAADPPDFYVGFGEPCAVTFTVAPGAECEPALFGLIAPGSRTRAGLPEDDLHPGEWYWSGVCKTYRAGGGRAAEESFLKRHIGLVQLLDHAATLGIDVHVEDESGYWRHRSSSRLRDCIRQMELELMLAEEEYVRWLERHPDHERHGAFEPDRELIESWLAEDQADGGGPK